MPCPSFTYFDTVQVEGREVGNPTGQRLESSIMQLVGGYSFTSWFALQINVPLIYRDFKRPEGFAIDRGTESGLGDVSLLSKIVLFHKDSRPARSGFAWPLKRRAQRRLSGFDAQYRLAGSS